MRPEQMAECLGILASAYPQDANKWSPERAQVWAAMLADLEYEALKGAIVLWVRSERWPPAVADLVELALDAGVRPELDAWAEVREQIQAVGSWGAPAFEDPLIREAIRHIGGWAVICQSTNEAADRARFAQAYATLASRQRREELCTPEVRAGLLNRALNALPELPE